MADTWNVTCSVSPCVIQHEIMLPPLQLTTEEGGLIAAAIVGVWAVGWAIRLIIRALTVADPKVEE